MYEYRVTLVGTWARKDTVSGDVGYMHRAIRSSQAKRRGITGDFHTYDPVVKGSGRTPQLRYGTFKVQVDITSLYASYVTPRASALKRAKSILTWYLSDTLCRGPVLEFDLERSEVIRYRVPDPVVE